MAVLTAKSLLSRLRAIRAPLRPLLLCLFTLPLLAEPLRIGRVESFSPLSEQSERVLRRAYGQLGLEVEFVRLPARRSLLLAASGQIDGDLHRIIQIGGEQPDLIRIPIAINRVEVGAYVRLGTPWPTGWNGLGDYRIAYLRGIRFIERHLERLPNKVETADLRDALRMVASRTVDIALLPRSEANVVLALEEIGQVREVPFPHQPEPLYHYLNRRHQHLVPQLSEVLLRMRRQGDLDNLEESVSKIK